MTNTPSPRASTQGDLRIRAHVPSRRRETGASNIESLYSPERNAAGIAEVEVETAALRRARARQAARFLKGPIPLNDVAVASRLPGQALAVFLAIHHRQALTRNPVVTLPKRLLAELGVTKDSKARALHALENAGLVNVERRHGRTPTITIISKGENREKAK